MTLSRWWSYLVLELWWGTSCSGWQDGERQEVAEQLWDLNSSSGWRMRRRNRFESWPGIGIPSGGGVLLLHSCQLEGLRASVQHWSPGFNPGWGDRRSRRKESLRGGQGESQGTSDFFLSQFFKHWFLATAVKTWQKWRKTNFLLRNNHI